MPPTTDEVGGGADTLVEGVNVKPLAYDPKELVVSIGCF
jgi:hypothetical protein